MIKLIRTEQLQPGMFIHDLNCDWIEHNFVRNRFAVKDAATVARVLAVGVREIYIDTARGLDVADAPTREEAQQALDARLQKMAGAPRPLRAACSLAEECHRARGLHRQAHRIVRGMMEDVRHPRPLPGTAGGRPAPVARQHRQPRVVREVEHRPRQVAAGLTGAPAMRRGQAIVPANRHRGVQHTYRNSCRSHRAAPSSARKPAASTRQS
jgi:hypothetical protein